MLCGAPIGQRRHSRTSGCFAVENDAERLRYVFYARENARLVLTILARTLFLGSETQKGRPLRPRHTLSLNPSLPSTSSLALSPSSSLLLLTLAFFLSLPFPATTDPACAELDLEAEASSSSSSSSTASSPSLDLALASSSYASDMSPARRSNTGNSAANNASNSGNNARNAHHAPIDSPTRDRHRQRRSQIEQKSRQLQRENADFIRRNLIDTELADFVTAFFDDPGLEALASQLKMCVTMFVNYFDSPAPNIAVRTHFTFSRALSLPHHLYFWPNRSRRPMSSRCAVRASLRRSAVSCAATCDALLC